MFAIHPGAVSPLRPLIDYMRDVHEADQALLPEESRRQFSPDPEHEGIRVALRVVSKKRYSEMALALADAKGVEHFDITRDFVRDVIHRVEGVEGASFEAGDDRQLGADALAVLDVCGLIGPLFAAAQVFTDLGPKGKRCFGEPRPSTSASSTAPRAPRRNSGDGVALEEPPALASEAFAAADTSLESVRCVSSSAAQSTTSPPTAGSGTRSHSTPPPMGES